MFGFTTLTGKIVKEISKLLPWGRHMEVSACFSFFSILMYISGMASIDSSAPETTSSDNSPTLGRRVPPGGWGRYHGHGPGSDSGSSGNSSDSISSSSSAERGPADPVAGREATERWVLNSKVFKGLKPNSDVRPRRVVAQVGPQLKNNVALQDSRCKNTIRQKCSEVCYLLMYIHNFYSQ